MSLWKFGDFEADVDFTDADFLDAIDEAKAAMHEAEQNVPVVGKNSDIIRAQCACFYVFFDTLFGEGAACLTGCRMVQRLNNGLCIVRLILEQSGTRTNVNGSRRSRELLH